MSKTAVVTARLDPETLAGLDRLAVARDRSRAWLIGRAVDAFVAQAAAFEAFLKEGDDAIDRGDFQSQDEMEAWVRAYGADAG